MKTSKKVYLTLSQRDRDLIRDHGYPFHGIEAALDAIPERTDVAVVTCDRFEFEQLLGDLARSINDRPNDDIQDRLNELYECIESDAAHQPDPHGSTEANGEVWSRIVD